MRFSFINRLRVMGRASLGAVVLAAVVHLEAEAQYLEPRTALTTGKGEQVEACIKASEDPFRYWPGHRLRDIYPLERDPRQYFEEHKASLLGSRDASRFLRNGRPCPVAENVFGPCEGPVTDKERSENFVWCLRFRGWQWVVHPTEKFETIAPEQITALLTRHWEGDANDRVQVERYFRQNFSRIDPTSVMMLAASILKRGNMEDALFWHYAGMLRWRVVQEISRDSNRGGAGAAIALSFGMGLPQDIAKDQTLQRKAVERALKFERAQGFEPGYLRQPFDKQRPEWAELFERARTRLAQSVGAQ